MMILHSCSAGNKKEVLMAAILAQENWQFGEGKCRQTIALVLRKKHNPRKKVVTRRKESPVPFFPDENALGFG